MARSILATILPRATSTKVENGKVMVNLSPVIGVPNELWSHAGYLF
jgi:hypothetical protein